VGKRSARDSAKQVHKRPAPRKRVVEARPWIWADVIWVTAALLVASVLTIVTLGNQFTALMPEEGVVGVRVALLTFFYLSLLAILAYLAHRRNLSFVDAYRLKPSSSEVPADRDYFPWWKSLLVMLGLFLVLRLFAILYTYVTGEFGWVTPPAAGLTDLFGATVFGLIAATVTIVFLAPFIEELVFRVIIFDTFARSMPFALALVLQGLVFSLYHFSLWAAIPNFLVAIACVYLIMNCRTSWPAILLHVLYNAAVVAAAFYLAMI